MTAMSIDDYMTFRGRPVCSYLEKTAPWRAFELQVKGRSDGLSTVPMAFLTDSCAAAEDMPLLRKRWQSDGNQMAIRWRSDGDQMAIRWQSDGNQMAIRWQSDGSQICPLCG